MNYKAQQLGIKIVLKFDHFPEDESQDLNIMSIQGKKIMVTFDNQRF